MLDAEDKQGGPALRYTPQESPVSGSGAMSFRAIFGMVLRRWWIVAACLAMALAGAVIAIKVLPRSYSATALVMLQNREVSVVDIKSIVSGIRLDPSAISSELTILESHKLLKAVADNLDLHTDPEFFPPENREEATKSWEIDDIVIGNLRKRVKVQQQDLSYVIEIAVTTRDEELSALIANAIANEYIQSQLEAKFEATRRATEYLSDKVDKLRTEVQAAELAVERFRAKQVAGDLQSPEALDRQIEDLSTKLIEAQEGYAAATARLREAERVVDAQGRAAGASLVATPVMTTLKTTEAELQRKLADLSSRYGPKHPKIVNMKGELADTRAAIQGEVGKTLQSLRSDHAVAKARLASLQGTLASLEEQRSGQSQDSLELRELERRSDASRLVYETFLKRFTETNESSGIKEADARIISEATPPTEPSAPKKGVLIIGAGVVGLVLGLVLALSVEYSISTFRTMEELEFQTGLPIIASVPAIRDGILRLGFFTRVLWRGEVGTVRREQKRLLGFVSYFHRRPNSAMAEAIRKIGTAIRMDAPTGEGGGRVVMFTSSVPAEGKSTLSCLVAKSAAARGERVVLVDCDLRSPSFSIEAGGHDADEMPKKDLIDVISGGATLDEALTPDRRFECDLLYPNRGVPNAGDLIARNSFGDMVRALKARYDLVVLDAPPAVAVSDAVTIGRLSDIVVYAVRWGFAARTTVLRGVRELEKGGAPVHGLVFTLMDNIREAQLRDPAAARDISRLRKYYNS